MQKVDIMDFMDEMDKENPAGLLLFCPSLSITSIASIKSIFFN
jgi:hypothetical protein